MRKENINVGNLMVQSLGAIAIHLVFAALAIAVLYLVSNDPSYVAGVPVEEANRTGNQDILTYALEDGFAILLNWTVLAFAVSAVASLLFIGFTASLSPQIEEDARSRKPLWSGLLIILLVVAAVLWWVYVISAGISDQLVSNSYVLTGALGSLFLILAYYCATAICVKSTMQRSVPFSAVMPSLGK